MKKLAGIFVLIIASSFIISCSDSGSSTVEDNIDNGDVLTYANFGSSFFSSYCTRCHAAIPLNGAPFSLESYSDVSSRIDRIIVRAVTQQDMPPSAPFPSSTELTDLSRWISEGALEN